MSPASQPPRPSAPSGRPFSLSLSFLSHRAPWLAVLLTLLAAGLRLYRLGNKSIWWDEGFSIFLARMPLAEMAAATAHDTHPPVYYALLHLWRLAAGDSAVAVRLLSVLAGVLVAPLAYRVVRPLAGKRAALAAMGLIALNRLLIWYSQEVRQYALAACLALASAALAIALWRALEQPLHRRAWLVWAAYVAVNAAGLQTLYLFVSVLLAQNLAFVIAVWRAPQKGRLALRWFSAQAAIALACLPWMLYYLPRAPHTFVPPSTLPPLGVLKLYLAALFAGEASDIDRFWLISLLGVAALGLGLLAALRHGRKTAAGGFTALLLVMAAIAPPAVIWLLNLPTGLGLSFVPNPRYFVVLAPWALCGLGLALGGWSRRWAGRLALIGVAVLWLSYAGLYYGARYLSDDFVSAAATLRAYRQADDAVVLHNDQNWPVAAYHLGGRDWLGLNSGRRIATEADAAQAVEAAWNAHAGLWLLVTPEALSNDPDQQVYGWLARRALTMRIFMGDPTNRLYFFARTPERAATADTLLPSARPRPTLALTPAPGLTLVRAEWALPEYRVGDPLRVFLYWQNDQAAGEYHYALRLNPLLGAPADTIAQTLVINADSPALVRQQVDFPVRAYVGAGLYWLELLAGPGQARLGLVTVTAGPAHAAVRTPPATAQAVQFEQGIALTGYTAQVQPGRLTLSPYWTTATPVDTRYKFFAHVLGDSVNPATGNQAWAQIDREPNYGATPVTTWRVGEVIADGLTFDLPAGRYTVALGWYDAFTGQRLLVLDASGAAVASEATLGPFVIPPPVD